MNGKLRKSPLKSLTERVVGDEIHGHPELVLRFLIQTFGISKEKLANRIGVDVKIITGLLRGARFSGQICIWLSQVFPGIEPEWWALQEVARSLRVARERWQRRLDVKPLPKPYWHKKQTEDDKCICGHNEWEHIFGCTIPVEHVGRIKRDEEGLPVLDATGMPLHETFLDKCPCPHYFRVGSLIAYQASLPQDHKEKPVDDPFALDFKALRKVR